MRLLLFLTLALAACQADLASPPGVASDPDPITTLTIDRVAQDRLLLGHSLQLTFTARRRSGTVADVHDGVTFRSTKPGTLSVDSTGRVTARAGGLGYVVVRLTPGSRVLQDSIPLLGVDPGFVVRLAPPGLGAIELGASVAVTLSAETAAGTPIPLPSPPRFRSTNPEVLTVDASGLVRSAATGSAYIIGAVATVDGDVADSLAISVVCTLELTAKYDPPPVPLHPGQSFPLRIRLTTCGGKVELTDEFTWFSADPAIVAIDPNGQSATARAVGETSIWAVGKKYGRQSSVPVAVTP